MSHSKIIVCPQPRVWADIHQNLLKNWKLLVSIDPTIPKPPVPLVLSGWDFTNDVDKKLRWEATKSWAERYGVSGSIPELKPDDWYSVEKLDDSNPNPYRNWNYKEKARPSEKEIRDLFEKIEHNWEEIVGEVFSEITWPLQFTGAKYRRLLVVADKNVVPPWGTWYSLSKIESERRIFTDFRRRINVAIHHHEVDHIDFVTKEKNMEHSIFINEVEVKLWKNEERFWKYGCVFRFPSQESNLIIEEICNHNFSARSVAGDHAIDYLGSLDSLAMNLQVQEELKNNYSDFGDLLDFL